MEQYVIIGNGVAAAACIEGIRSVDPDGSITVVSEEAHPVYCRPLISYYLEDKTDLERILYRPADFYEAHGCRLLCGVKAERLDPAQKQVFLGSGEVLPYTKLCIATGSAPFVPPVKGLDTVPAQFTFMTLDDAIALKNAVNKDSRVLIVGAGLIGLKCAEGLKELAAEITVCDLADRILSSILDAQSAAFVQNRLEAQGIRFLLADSAERFEGNTACMKSGKRVEFDVLVMAVGVRANSALVRDAGGAVNRGICIDARMCTTLPDVYAVGDCSVGYDSSIGSSRVLALLPNATQQGYRAGINMAGGDRTFEDAIPMNSIGLLGTHMMTAGTRFAEEQGGSAYEEADAAHIKKLFFRDGLLTGFILIDDTARAGIYTAMIRSRTPLDSVNFELLKQTPSSAMFTPEVRAKMFGGVV